MSNQSDPDLETLKSASEVNANSTTIVTTSSTVVNQSNNNQQNYQPQYIHHEDQMNENHRGHRHHGMTQMQKCLIVAFTIAMPCNVLILEHFWLTEPLKENEFEYKFSLLFLDFVFSFSLISYYYSIKIKNALYKKQPPEVDHHYLPEIYKNNRKCEAECGGWKPLRAHHCRQCNACNTRMDHHCPWTINCVGSKNHKAFYLFCLYMGLGSTQYCYRTIYFFIHESDNGTLLDYSGFFFLYWILTSFVLFPICMMLVSLSIFHSCAALTNATTLESMSGTSVNCCNNAFNDQIFTRTTNLYDRGVFANYIYFLGNSLFLFWFPTPVLPDKDGTEFPMSPPLTYGETIKLSGKMEILDPDQYYSEKNKYMDNFTQQASIEYKHVIFQNAGKIFEHFKKS